MKTKFIKVSTEERLPDFGNRVIGLVLEQTDLGLSKFLWNVYYDDRTRTFIKDGENVNIEFWLEEVPDRESEMLETLKTVYPLLHKRYLYETANSVLKLIQEATTI